MTGKESGRLQTAGWACFVAGVLGLIGNFYLFMIGYKEIIAAYALLKKMPSVKLLTYVFPAFHDLGVVAAIALLVAAFGFLSRREWAWVLAVAAVALGLVSAWLPIVWPLMISMPVRYMAIFVPYLLLWILLIGYVRPMGARVLLLSLASGIAMVLAAMSGTAALTKLLGSGSPIYIATQQLNWIAAAAWGVFTVGLLLKRSWALPLGLATAGLATISGYPVAYYDSIETSEFSMFAIGPTVSLLLLILLLWRQSSLWEQPAGRSRPDIAVAGE